MDLEEVRYQQFYYFIKNLICFCNLGYGRGIGGYGYGGRGFYG